jgi:uncharacterized YccA/Bax inhibitor family protein
MIRSSNPVLRDRIFEGVRNVPSTERMTINGTINKTAFSLLITIVTAFWTYSDQIMQNFAFPAIILGFLIALAITFVPKWAPMLTPLYAAVEGCAVGAISLRYSMFYEGIVFQAVSLTFGVLFCMLMLYKSGKIKVTDRLRWGISAAVGAICLVYLFSFILSLFSIGGFAIWGNGPVGIGFSIIIVGVAAFSLLLDFDLIERAAHSGAPRFMEWYGAFALLVTLIWLYLEILRLLSKLQRD